MTPFNKIGGVGGSQLLSQLNLEVGKMAEEAAKSLGDLKGSLAALSQAFQQAAQGKGGNADFSRAVQVTALALKLAYVAVLQAAVEKATKSQNFNVETAINDLWTSLDSVKKLGAGQQQGSPSIDVETMKLKRMIDKRSQMFDVLGKIIEKYDQTARSVMQNMR